MSTVAGHRSEAPLGRLLRGGSWYFNPQFCRAAYRYYRGPSFRFDSFGFRVARLP